MTTPRDVPPPLIVAASLAGVEGLALCGLGLVEMANVRSDLATMGLTTALFFASYGVLLVVAGLGLSRGRTWARGPVLMTQLVILGVAWGIHDDVPAVITVALVLAAVLTLAGLVHPASVEHLGRAEAPEDPARPA